MSTSTSYPGLDDSWFDHKGKPRRALRRADVFAELERKGADVGTNDEVTFDSEELKDSWFDRRRT